MDDRSQWLPPCKLIFESLRNGKSTWCAQRQSSWKLQRHKSEKVATCKVKKLDKKSNYRTSKGFDIVSVCSSVPIRFHSQLHVGWTTNSKKETNRKKWNSFWLLRLLVFSFFYQCSQQGHLFQLTSKLFFPTPSFVPFEILRSVRNFFRNLVGEEKLVSFCLIILGFKTKPEKFLTSKSTQKKRKQKHECRKSSFTFRLLLNLKQKIKSCDFL